MSRRGERGAVVAIVALMMVVVLGIASLAVDLGMQRVARRDMQTLADAVALDLSRLVDGRTADQIVAGGSGLQGLDAAMQASRQRNDVSTLGDAPVVSVVLISLDAMGDPVMKADGSGVQPVTGAAVPAAVYVTASTSVDFAFTVGRGGAVRTAVGVSQSVACFRLGSFAAGISSTNSPVLNRYLNQALGLSAISYEGLANATVTTKALATQLGVGTVDELVALKGVSLQRLFLASATVLQSQGGDAADVSLLNSLSTSVSSAMSVDIDKLMSVSTGGAAALETSLNVLDLVGAAAFVASGSNALSLPVLWNVPQFSSGATSLQVIERPQRACGRINEARAQTAQLKVAATPKLNVPTIDGLAEVTSGGASVNLAIDLAGADALLTGIRCGAATTSDPESITTQVSSALASTATLAIPIHLTGQLSASGVINNPVLFGLSAVTSLLGLKATVDITVNAGVSSSYPAAGTSATYAVPPHTYADPEHVGGSGGVVLPHVVLDNSDLSGTITFNGVTKNLASINLSSDVDLSGVLNDLVSKNVLAGINAFIDNVNAQLTPLTQLLGIQVAGADLFGVASPSCNSPALQG